jgi:DNA-binding transcriptional regulator YiaG
MSNVTAILQEMIRRLARHEVKPLAIKTKQAVQKNNRELRQLKRLVAAQEKQLARVAGKGGGQAVQHVDETSLTGVRFSIRSVKAQRRRLKLSAGEFGKLLGVTAQTVYNWEHGTARPRKAQLAALVSARQLGRRAVSTSLWVSGKNGSFPLPQAVVADPKDKALCTPRFIRLQRRRLGLSLRDFGKLAGVTGQTVFNWEAGKVHPRDPQVIALVEVRGLERGAALEKLALLKTSKE